MKRVPHAQGVVRALRSVRAAAQKSLKGLNLAASQRMAKGDYTGAETLAARGKEIRQFQSEVEVLRKRWREVCGAGSRAEKKTTTALWVYYQPVLQALVQAGGECRRTDLETHVERIMGPSLQPGDRVVVSRGRERWRVMVRRARRPLTAEGWVQSGAGKLWKITDAGRRAAEQPITKGISTRK
ncbi:MAG TPA: winged helix-turn-helix domain-containing protein [Candidatus Binatia bacterium]|nr:winged helix-turn-helix domain-containing protein [Candidatus Binatia bacterium]